jgi:hypothetical protein
MSGFYSDIKASSGVYKFYVNGAWKESTSGKSVSILNPTSNQAVYQVQGEGQCMQLTACCDLLQVCIVMPVARCAPDGCASFLDVMPVACLWGLAGTKAAT